MSLLDRLKAPTPSDLARKRKIACNPPPKGKKRSCGRGANNPKSVTPIQRVKENPDECLTVSNKQLFCRACREELSLISSVVHNHVKSAKHQAGRKRLAAKEVHDIDIAAALKASDEVAHRVGETLPQDQRVYRVKVVTAFLWAAVPLNKLEHFRELLEEHAFRLSDRRHKSDIIPFISLQEHACIKEEISRQYVSVIYDGTTRLEEAMAIVLRFVDWELQQRLVRLQLLAKSMTGEEIARELVNVLSVQYDISSDFLLSTMRDRASVNNVALRTLKVIYPNVLDVGCFSHTLDIVGSKFSTPDLNNFMMTWVSLFSHSPKARLLWRVQTGQSTSSYSPTRWWSRWEVMKQLLELYGDVEAFLRTHEDLAPATRTKLLRYLDVPQRKSCIELELAVTVDAGLPFVQAAYKLEGDGPLALQCYEVVASLAAAVNMAQPHYPNVLAVSRKLCGGNVQLQ